MYHITDVNMLIYNRSFIKESNSPPTLCQKSSAQCKTTSTNANSVLVINVDI